MEWNVISDLIDPRLFIVVAVCWIIGGVLKKTPKVPDWSVVYIVVLFAVWLAIGLLGWSVENLIQGILAGAFAVLGHQFVKQGKEGVEANAEQK